MTTDIVILNWNGKGLLEKYLPGVLQSVEGLQGVKVVVADNASDDGSVEFLKENFPDVDLTVLSRNYGFAEGYNRALAKSEADCFLLLNSDVEVTRDWFIPLQEWMILHPDCGICGPKLHQTGKREMFEYAGAAGGYLDSLCFPFCRGRVMGLLEKDEGQYDIPAEVLWVSGAALMIRRELFRSLGGFCKEFFAHMEEIDLCWRARLEGWKVNVVPRSTVYHLGGASLPQDSPYKLFLNYRNNLHMMSRCLPGTLAIDYVFNIAGEAVDPDEGPDIFGCCSDFYNENDRMMKKDLAQTAALLAAQKSAGIIARRMIVDILAAISYLLRGRYKCFKAVIKAHRDFRRRRPKTDIGSLRRFTDAVISGKRLDIARNILTEDPLEGNWKSATFALKGHWNKWIVLQSFLKKDAIFAYIKDNLK